MKLFFIQKLSKLSLQPKISDLIFIFWLKPTKNSYTNLLVMGGIPNNIQTYELAQGTVMFEARYNGFIRNVRALNCSSEHMSRLNVVASSSLRYPIESDACMSNPCLNRGVCSILTDATMFKCDCSYTNYEGQRCEKRKICFFVFCFKRFICFFWLCNLCFFFIVKPPKSSSELTFTGKEYFSYEMPSDSTSSYEEEMTIDFKTTRSTGLLAYAGMFLIPTF